MTDRDDESGKRQDRVGELMQRAGRRVEPPDQVRAAVYGAARSAWQGQLRTRMHRRQLAIAASLLGCAVLTGLAWLRQGGVSPPQTVASVAAVMGDVRVHTDSGAGDSTSVASERSFKAGEQIETAVASRVTLRRPSGILIHVAGGSELVWQSADALRLTRGLIYIDTEDAGGPDALEVITHTGRIRHVGTRFSVQVADLEVRVMVRDGAVRIGSSRAEQRLGQGYAARIDAEGRVTADTISAGEGPWHWLATERPQFIVEGRSLHAVLADMAQADGVQLRYGSATVESSAHQLVLHGPPLELDATRAIDAVLLTTQFTRRAPLEIVQRP
jgi:hypothetical protein